MEQFWYCCVPLFVAMDAVGLLPIYSNLTDEMTPAEQRRTLRQSVLTALLAAVAFLFVGQWLFRLLGISIADFMIAGGILLLAFAVNDLLKMEKRIRGVHRDTVGAVPIGVPLMVGPAVLTATILLADQHGYFLTVLAIVANVVIAGVVFGSSQGVNRLLGSTGVRTISKITSVILAAYGVMMVRKGCQAIVEGLSELAT